MRSDYRQTRWQFEQEPLGRDRVGQDNRVPLAGYEGTAGDDLLRGGRSGDFFDVSQGGDDVVVGRGGADMIYFGAAYTGADRVDGGKGPDVVTLEGDYSAGVHIAAESLVHIETLDVRGGSYVITGELAYETYGTTYVYAEMLRGLETLTLEVASKGNLSAVGGWGDDVLHAAANGADSYLNGSRGDDVLIGGSGMTLFQGGNGADRIEMTTSRDIVQCVGSKASNADKYDTIVNFEESGGRIQLAFDSDTSVRDNQYLFHLGATPERTGDILFAYDAEIGDTVVRVFTDGDETADVVIHLTGDVQLTTDDFIFGR